MKHPDPHPQAGKDVKLRLTAGKALRGPDEVPDGTTCQVEDWFDRIARSSPGRASLGNVLAVGYAMRSTVVGLPADDEVVYVTVRNRAHLVHATELEPEP